MLYRRPRMRAPGARGGTGGAHRPACAGRARDGGGVAGDGAAAVRRPGAQDGQRGRRDDPGGHRRRAGTSAHAHMFRDRDRHRFRAAHRQDLAHRDHGLQLPRPRRPHHPWGRWRQCCAPKGSRLGRARRWPRPWDSWTVPSQCPRCIENTQTDRTADALPDVQPSQRSGVVTTRGAHGRHRPAHGEG